VVCGGRGVWGVGCGVWGVEGCSSEVWAGVRLIVRPRFCVAMLPWRDDADSMRDVRAFPLSLYCSLEFVRCVFV